MQIDSLKAKRRFLNGGKIKCLAGKFQPNALATIKTDAVAIKDQGAKGGQQLTPAERRQNGLESVAELTLTDVVMDDIRKLVFLIFA